MPTITVTTKEAAELVKMSFQNLEDGSMKIGREQIYRMFQHIAKRARVYPDPLPYYRKKGKKRISGKSGTYKRTYELQRSVEIIKVDNDTYSISVNPREINTKRRRRYGMYVKGDAYGRNQARIHRNRWIKLRDEFEDELSKLPAMILNALKYSSRKDVTPAGTGKYRDVSTGRYARYSSGS